MHRYLLRDWVESHVIHRFPQVSGCLMSMHQGNLHLHALPKAEVLFNAVQWAAVDSALSKEGWKLITLLRLSPIIPWNFLNYAVSITGVLSQACVQALHVLLDPRAHWLSSDLNSISKLLSTAMSSCS